MTQLPTTIIIERDFDDPAVFRVTICPGVEYCKVTIETNRYLLSKSNIPYKMKRGTTQKHYFKDIGDFIKTLARSELTYNIIMAVLRKVIMMLNLN